MPGSAIGEEWRVSSVGWEQVRRCPQEGTSMSGGESGLSGESPKVWDAGEMAGSEGQGGRQGQLLPAAPGQVN